ncbi:MAG: IS5 family transposase [Bifidobacterium sp.]|nr:IS5 family transposase [Bifidobacterium sp.]
MSSYAQPCPAPHLPKRCRLISREQYDLVAHLLPTPRGNARVDAYTVLCAVLWVLSTGCYWDELAACFGKPSTIYQRWRRWVIAGIAERLFEAMAGLRIQVDGIPDRPNLDSSSVKVDPAAMTGRGSHGQEHVGLSRGGKNTKIHAACAAWDFPVAVHLSAGNRYDGPQALPLFARLGAFMGAVVNMDRAWEGERTRLSAEAMGLVPNVLPKRNRRDPWPVNVEVCKERNHIERHFLWVKRFRRINTRYDRLDAMYLAGVLLVESLLHLRKLAPDQAQ